MQLLKELVEVRGASGDEVAIKDFILKHIDSVKSDWTVQPQIFQGKGFQDAVVLVFGDQPTTAIFAHIDTIGFTVGYNNDLIKTNHIQTIFDAFRDHNLFFKLSKCHFLQKQTNILQSM